MLLEQLELQAVSCLGSWWVWVRQYTDTLYMLTNVLNVAFKVFIPPLSSCAEVPCPLIVAKATDLRSIFDTGHGQDIPLGQSQY